MHDLDFLDFLVNCRSDEFKIGLVGTVIGDDVYAVIFSLCMQCMCMQ